MPRLDLDPWERSAESALRFAFGMLAREVSVPSVFGSMLARGPMNNRELSRLDLRAQAAVLRQEVQALSDPVVKAWLVAYYLPKPVPERQPGGRYVQVDPWTTDRQNAVVADGAAGDRLAPDTRLSGDGRPVRPQPAILETAA
jgi:hypothetical protein